MSQFFIDQNIDQKKKDGYIVNRKIPKREIAMVKDFYRKYELEDLKKQFGLEELHDTIAIPLMQAVLFFFHANLEKNPALFGATDVEHMGGIGIWIIVDGKMINTAYETRAIDHHDDDDPGLQMCSQIYFYEDEAKKEQIEKVFGYFKEFISQLRLEDLKLLAADYLRKRKNDHLIWRGITDYFGLTS